MATIPSETGEQNAQRFVAVVKELARTDKVIILWGEPGMSGHANRDKVGWTWMANQAWRERVFKLLDGVDIRDGEFTAPDSLDGWTFVAYSTAHKNKVEELSLDDAIDPNDLTASARVVTVLKKSYKPICWWCFGLLALAAVLSVATCSYVKREPAPVQSLEVPK